MNPASLIPLAEPLPIPWAWFDILLILTFTAHILFMNALVGSATIGLVRSLRGDGGIAKDVGKKLPPLIALTINMGVAPLLFLQVNYGHFDYVSSVLMGGWWLGVILALILSYYGFYIFKFSHDDMSKGKRTTLFAASLLGVLYVGFMLSNNMTLMIRPEVWARYFSEGTGILNMDDPTIYPRFLHFMVGAIAIGGLFIALLGQVRKVDEYIEVGMTWFVRATLVNLLMGLWFLMALPGDMVLKFMGSNLPATLTIITSLLSAGIMLSAGFRKHPTQAAIWAVTTVFFMSCTRHWVRTFHLEPWYPIESTPITYQYGSLYLFLGFLVVGLALVAYMMKLYFKARAGRA